MLFRMCSIFLTNPNRLYPPCIPSILLKGGLQFNRLMNPNKIYKFSLTKTRISGIPYDSFMRQKLDSLLRDDAINYWNLFNNLI